MHYSVTYRITFKFHLQSENRDWHHFPTPQPVKVGGVVSFPKPLKDYNDTAISPEVPMVPPRPSILMQENLEIWQ